MPEAKPANPIRRSKESSERRTAYRPTFPAATADELAALDALGKEGTWQIGGHELKLTNLDKPLFEGLPGKGGKPESPITKRELIRYFATIAPTMLPHLYDRPLNLQRFPNGAGRPGFWQKNIPETAPKWLTRWHETGVDGRADRDANDHLLADRRRRAVLAREPGQLRDPCLDRQAARAVAADVRLHRHRPRREDDLEETLVLARLYRTALGHLGVRGYPKTTGKRGIQIWIPIVHGKYDFHDTSAWVERVSRAVGSTVPDLISWEWAKERAQGPGAARLHPERVRSRRSSRRIPCGRR